MTAKKYCWPRGFTQSSVSFSPLRCSATKKTWGQHSIENRWLEYYVVSFPIGSMYMHIYLGKYTYQAHGSYGFWDAFRFNLQGAPMAVAAAWLQVQSPRRRPWGRRFCTCCNWVVNDGAMMWKKHEQMVRIWWLHGKKWWTYIVKFQETLGAELKTRCEYMWFDVIFQYQNVNQKNEIWNLKLQKGVGCFLLNIGVHIWQCSSIFSPSGLPGGHPSRFTTRAWLRLHSHRLFGPNWNPCKVQLDAGYRNLVVGVLGADFNVFFVVFTPEIGEDSQFDEQYFFRWVETTNYSVVFFFCVCWFLLGWKWLKGETMWDGLIAHSFLALFQLTEICGVSWCWKQDGKPQKTPVGCKGKSSSRIVVYYQHPTASHGLHNRSFTVAHGE